MSFLDSKPSKNKKKLKSEREDSGFEVTRVPLPHELTAEWTIKAYLKFAKAGEIKKKEFNSDDTVHPVCVNYKWSTLDGSDKNYEFNYDNNKVPKSCSISSTHSQDPTKDTSHYDAGYGADSLFSSSNNSQKRQSENLQAEDKNSVVNFYGTRCQSTCNITITAIADFLPPTEVAVLSPESIDTVPMQDLDKDSKSFVFKTTANYIEQSQNKEDPTIDSSTDKFINLRDAICQTSDTETKHSDDVDQKESYLERRDSRRLYRKLKTDDSSKKIDYRGRTDGENYFKPSYSPSTTQTRKSRTVPHVPKMIGEHIEAFGKRSQSFIEPQKKPRTVHIDVYCTGSEDEGHADGESSSEDDSKKVDQESNSTFQTVMENEQMRLSHHRITGASLPRRLAEQDIMSENLKNVNIGHALTKSSTIEEVNESKQLLFRKHIGDQRAAKLQNIRQKYLRQLPDDTLSLGYPNSSKSTIRDNTCSSISSALVEASWKETDDTEEPSLYSLAKSDSFEYENTLDRLRIRQMEHLWSRNYSNEEELKFPNLLHTQPGNSSLQTISELTSLKRSLSRSSDYPTDILPDNRDLSEIDDNLYAPGNIANCKLQQISHVPKNTSGFLQFFGPPSNLQSSSQTKEENLSLQQPQLQSCLHPNYNPYLQRWKSETRDNLSASETSILTPTEISRQSSPLPHLGRSASEAPVVSTENNTLTTTTPTFAKRFDIYHRTGPIEIDEFSQAPPIGYSLEYLHKAKMFGNVVAARKPGHHIGPTKNPSCTCECCQRWLNERRQSRSQVFALGEMPILKRPS